MLNQIKTSHGIPKSRINNNKYFDLKILTKIKVFLVAYSVF